MTINAKDKKELQVEDFATLIRTNGMLDGVQMPIADALSTSDAPSILSKVFTELTLETIQARSLVPYLVQTMNHEGIIGESTSYRWFGAGNVPNILRSEGGEYPEFTPQAGKSNMVRAQFAQYGLVVRVTEEQIKYNRWDMVAKTVNAAALALERGKEALIMDVFLRLGVVVFDNTDTAAVRSIKGVATGHDRKGNANGSFSYDDYVDMFNVQSANGYSPNVVLIHPFSLPIFQKDPMLRHMGFVSGNPGAFLSQTQNSTNAYSNGTVDTWRKQQRKATGTSQTLTGREVELTSNGFSKLPSYSPLSGVSVITSHMVEFDPVSQTTSIIMIDTGASGVLNQQKPLTVD